MEVSKNQQKWDMRKDGKDSTHLDPPKVSSSGVCTSSDFLYILLAVPGRALRTRMLGQGAANPGGGAATGTTEGAKHQRNAMMSTCLPGCVFQNLAKKEWQV